MSARAALHSLSQSGGAVLAGTLPRRELGALYSAGCVRYEVPITARDRVGVPPLVGFVMNRVKGDWLEKLLYDMFVSTD
eukprot:2966287-Pleurochrysis_carterae.AAC.1